jgi:hypothetical protein
LEGALQGFDVIMNFLILPIEGYKDKS